MTLGFAPRRATAMFAVLSGLLLGLLLAQTASGKVKTFSPTAKTRSALIFKLNGIKPQSVRRARALLRVHHGKAHTKRLSIRRIRRAARRGKMRIRRQARPARRRTSGKSRRTARGGRVKVLVEKESFVVQAPRGEPSPPTGGTYAVPDAVPSGCRNDATREIGAWIASVPDNSTLQFAADSCYRIEGTLELSDRDLAIDGNGSTFKSLEAPAGQRAMWRAWNSTLRLRDMKLIGSYANGGTHDEELQWAHGIDLRGTDALIENVSMSDLAGDCVYFGLGDDRSSGALRDSACRRTGRNGVSVVAGDDIRVERVTTDQIGFVVFDVEPNKGPGNGSSRVVFDSNTIGSYEVYAWAVIGNAPISDQAFTNNHTTGTGLRIGALYPTHHPTRLSVRGNTSSTATWAPAMRFDGVDKLRVTANTVRMTDGAMAVVDKSCAVFVSGNSYPGGSKEKTVTDRRC